MQATTRQTAAGHALARQRRPAHAPSGPRADLSRRRFAAASGVGIAISAAAFAWLVTDGTFNFFQTIPFGSFYDVQARSWLRGTWSMPANVLTIEGIRTHGRTDMYFGPVPALLRLPVLLVTHDLDGRLTEVSLLIAFVVALVFVSLLSWKVRQLVRGSAVVSRLETALTAALIVVVGLGSVFFFLGSTAQVYEEAALWGAAFALGAMYTLVCFLERPSGRLLAFTGVLASLAILTRVSVGLGVVVALALTAAVYVLTVGTGRLYHRQPARRRIAQKLGISLATRPGAFAAGLVAVTVIPLALYMVINEVKFGTLFSLPLTRQVFTSVNPHERAVLASNGGSLFAFKYVPTDLVQFLRPDALAITHLFPWVVFPGKGTIIGNVVFGARDWTSSIPASMPLLFVLALLGLVVVYTRILYRNPAASPSASDPGEAQLIPTGWIASRGVGGLQTGEAGPATLRIPLVGAAFGTIGFLTIAWLSERYIADAMPFVLLAALAGWHVVLARAKSVARHWRIVGALLLGAFALFQLWTNYSLTLFYQYELGPVISIPQRASMVSLQQRVGRIVFGGASGVQFVSSPPSHAATLDLAVLPDCGGVYQYDGTTWQPAEIGKGEGGLRFSVALPQSQLGRRQPMVVTGGRTPEDVVAVTWNGGNRYSFSYLFDQRFFGVPPKWFTAPAISVASQPVHQIQVDLVARVGLIFVTVDGTQAFRLSYPVAAPDQVRFGSAPSSVGTTATFAGRIHPVPVPTPICNELTRSRS